MMSSTSGDVDGMINASIVRGGPIYINNFVGPLTRVPEFESTLFHELEELKLELCGDSSSLSFDDDILVEELKMFSDEDLVDMALKETLEPSQKHSNTREGEAASTPLELHGDVTLVDTQPSKRRRCLKASEESQSGTSSNDIIITDNKLKTGKGRKANKHALEASCLTKAKDVLKIKQKQDEDRANARLHSLSCKTSVSASEKTQGIQYLRFTNSGTQLKPSNLKEYVDVQHSDVVLSIEVYHNIQQWTKTQELLVLGRQPSELRDKIYCTTDQVMQKEGKHDPSGYFLIEDVFFNDMRGPSAIDYSQPIFDWLRESKVEALKKWECIVSGELLRKQKDVIGEVQIPHLPPFRRVEMQKTRFCDLRFRLGAGYLYCHQGDCKHMIVIRDMRLIHPEDLQNRSGYPIVTFQLKLRVEKCRVCKIFRATKVTMDDKWAPYNPCYFCNGCYYLLHHSENGSLLYTDFSTSFILSLTDMITNK